MVALLIALALPLSRLILGWFAAPPPQRQSRHDLSVHLNLIAPLYLNLKRTVFPHEKSDVISPSPRLEPTPEHAPTGYHWLKP